MSKKNTHNLRRLKYTLNTTIAIAVALAIITIINVIAYRQAKQFDFSATRSHLLSQQTKNALSQLKNKYNITALINHPKPNSPAADQTTLLIDLIKQYDRQSSNISAKHVYLSDTLKRNAFLNTINKQFAKDPALNNLRKQITKSHQFLKSSLPPTQKLSSLVNKTLSHPKLNSPSLRQTLNTANIALKQIISQQEKVNLQTQQQLDLPLSDLTLCKNAQLFILLGPANRPIALYPQLTTLAQSLTRHQKSPRTPIEILEPIAKMINQAKVLLHTLTPLTQALQSTKQNPAYDKFIRDINTGQTVIIQQNQKIQTIPLAKIFTQSNTPTAKSTTATQINFLGEELITGNIIKMSLSHRPRIVFVSTTGKDPLNNSPDVRTLRPNAKQAYTYIAHRLKNLKFDIQTWQPNHTSKGTPRKFAPHPEAKNNQKTIWVLLPLREFYHRNQDKTIQIKKTIQYIKDKVHQGDSAMLLLNGRPGNTIPHPITPWLKNHNILLDSNKYILKLNLQREKNKQFEAFFNKNTWLDTNPIAKALHGSPGLLYFNFPLQLPQNSTTVKPLLQLSQGTLWAEQETDPQKLNKPEKSEIKPTFNIACTIQNKNSRIIVTTAKNWATDLIAGNTDPGILEEFAANNFDLDRAYPANTSLFINSIYWLANLDQLIGSNPRSTAVRRIDQINETQRAQLRTTLVILLPLLALIAGTLVYRKRHRH